MVTGEKPDEQVDWSEVARVEEEVHSALGYPSLDELREASVNRLTTPLRDAIDRISIEIFGFRARDLPKWLSELDALEERGRLPKRLRKRRASLRWQAHRIGVLAFRAAQRRRIGLPDV